ncbi:formylglycine-generating enzyme family protein [Roseibacillus ishigakijimensis]|uniref:Formylglycine-generating enzyme family protein n=1 Tax=Roseibacillus ishigakijimensis TaxID=454146 RepID=A0A934VMA6_9BACT|nr:formylglycine-generating enzyme family protein [Roseibacillus ishigakijimensis]MBK1833896.1 formylglycine-generating enzyme family protein [Roseibacillus ishigakijimensis]
MKIAPLFAATFLVGPLYGESTTGLAPTVTILPQTPAELPAPDQLEISRKIHALIVAKAKEEASHENYEVPVPKAGDKPLKLIAIPGGSFLMGSPAEEEGRNEDEGPQQKVTIAPFWMSPTEITWAHYNPFWQNNVETYPRNKDGTIDTNEDRYVPEKPDLEKHPLIDAVSQPTTQIMDQFLNGEFIHSDEYPAMNMTNHAAAKFCQWLSAQTGHFYRLPTEAEWEYACRAGTTTAYSFGDDASQLGDFAWFVDNGDFTYHPVAGKKPNPWGLYDMHGNVAEWTIDQYAADSIAKLPENVTNPWVYPTKRYPRVIRGGSWDHDATGLRSAARAQSDKNLKMRDPQIPKSVWYHTGGQHVGFRVVRPLEIPSAEEMHLFWNTDYLTPERTAEDL